MEKFWIKLASLFVIMVLFTGILACAPKVDPTFSQEDATRSEDAKIVYEDENTRIVEAWENGVCYRTEYNKKDNIIVLHKIVNGKIENSTTYDVDEIESAAREKNEEKDITYPVVEAEDAGRTETAKLVFEDEITRIAEGWERGVCYRAEFNKTEHMAVVYEIVDEQVVKTTYVEFPALDNATQASLMALPTEGSVLETKSGFGFSMGDQVNTFTCPYELVENETFAYQEIKVHKEVEPDLHELLTNMVDSLSYLEERFCEKVNERQLQVFYQVIFSCVESPKTMGLTTYVAVSGVELIEDFHENVYERVLDCVEYYFKLSLLSIPPVQ